MSPFRWMFAVASLTTSTAALAQGLEDLDPPPRQVEVKARFEVHTHFVAGEYDYTRIPMRLAEGDVVGGAGAVTPFDAAPYDRFAAYGVEVGGRMVINGLRTGVALREPVPAFNLAEGLADRLVVGEDREVSARSLDIHALRFELGYEGPWDAASPFVDLVGEYHWVRTDLAIDGEQVTYRGHAFGYGLQGGLRVRAAPFTHVVFAGEVGLAGQERWSAQVGVAYRFGFKGTHTYPDDS